ncbi:MAG: ABC transporter ATP-binding protein [Cyanobacteria bacterium P01_D01_bin.1]
MDIIKRLLYILPAKNIELLRTILQFIAASCLEVFGIGIIGPFLGLATDPALLHERNFLKSIYSASGVTEESTFIAILGIVVILVFCFKSFVAWYTQAYIAMFSDEQQRLIINKMIGGYLQAPYIYHTKKNSSSIIDTIIEVANTFTLGILNPLLTSIANLFVMLAIFILLFSTSQLTMLVILVIFLPVIAIFNASKEKVQVWGRTTRQSKESIIKIVNHAFGSVKETKVIGCESYFESQISAQTQRLKDSHSSFVAFKIMPRFMVESLMILCVVGVVVIFLMSGRNTQELIPVLGVYALAAIRILPAISNTVVGLSVLKNSSFTINQIYSDLKELEQLEVISERSASSSQAITTERSQLLKESSRKLEFEHSITIDNISYKYPQTDKYSLNKISLTLNKGESIAFIGKSGAGKTTLVDVILGLLTAQEGDILVDGVSIYSDIRSWQNIVGYIPQTIYLTDDTLARNIAFGVEDALIDREKLQEAIKLAQLSDVVEKLPKGLETMVGERGILLSGGQRQRVGIARALYGESEILVLDEATAALDNETEKLVSRAISALSGKKTLIMIAHRLSTVESCDRLYMLEEGCILKSGSFVEVVPEEVRV